MVNVSMVNLIPLTNEDILEETLRYLTANCLSDRKICKLMGTDSFPDNYAVASRKASLHWEKDTSQSLACSYQGLTFRTVRVQSPYEEE